MFTIIYSYKAAYELYSYIIIMLPQKQTMARRLRRTSATCRRLRLRATANLRTNIMDFRGFDSSMILIIRAGIPRPMGNFLESLSQAILVGIMLVGRLGVSRHVQTVRLTSRARVSSMHKADVTHGIACACICDCA